MYQYVGWAAFLRILSCFTGFYVLLVMVGSFVHFCGFTRNLCGGLLLYIVRPILFMVWKLIHFGLKYYWVFILCILLQLWIYDVNIMCQAQKEIGKVNLFLLVYCRFYLLNNVMITFCFQIAILFGSLVFDIYWGEISAIICFSICESFPEWSICMLWSCYHNYK